MRMITTLLLTAALVTEPAQAATWAQDAANPQPGTFVGARVQMRLGSKVPARPQAALMVAPTLTRHGPDGSIRMRIGEGVALNFKSGAKPSLTLAGVRADKALGLGPQGQSDAERKLGISTAGWVGIGVGVAALAFGAYYVVWLSECHEECE